MPFIKRDINGEIIALFREQNAEAGDYLPPHHPEIQAFIEPAGNDETTNGESEVLTNMVRSDLEMIRVYEDLVDVLISKHVVVLTDFPQAAQEKLMRRKRLRSSFSNLTEALAVEEDEGIFRI
jgi:hypothetical protein